MTVRVAVTDYQNRVRTGQLMIPEAQTGIEVVGRSADGRIGRASRVTQSVSARPT